MANKTYGEILNALPWTQEQKDKLQQVVRYSDHIASCMTTSTGFQTTSNHSNYPKIDEEYAPENECTTIPTTTTDTNGSNNTYPALLTVVVAMVLALLRGN